MAREIPIDRLTVLMHEYHKKFGDYVPRSTLHGSDPEGVIRAAIKSDEIIPELLPGSSVLDNQ